MKTICHAIMITIEWMPEPDRKEHFPGQTGDTPTVSCNRYLKFNADSLASLGAKSR